MDDKLQRQITFYIALASSVVSLFAGVGFLFVIPWRLSAAEKDIVTIQTKYDAIMIELKRIGESQARMEGRLESKGIK